jgi:hypothetical protein
MAHGKGLMAGEADNPVQPNSDERAQYQAFVEAETATGKAQTPVLHETNSK